MDNIPEFYETDAEWESGEYANLKRQWDRMLANSPEQRLRGILQRVADFDFLSTLDATPSPEAREAYTRLMVDVRLALRVPALPGAVPAREGEK